MIPTLLSLPLYIIWARMNTGLQLIVYHTAEKMCGQCWWEHWRRACKPTGISVFLLSCIFYYKKTYTKLVQWPTCLCNVWMSGHPLRPGRFTPRRGASVDSFSTRKKSLALFRHRITVPGSSSSWPNHAAEHVTQDTLFKRQIIKRNKVRLLAHFTQVDVVTLHRVGTVP
jgi:hypothetical protein